MAYRANIVDIITALMFKILYLTQFPEIGGGETILISLLENLDSRKFEPIVVVPQKGQLSQKLEKLRIKTHLLKLNPYLFRTFFVPGASPSAIAKLIKLVREIKPDIIHLNHLTLAVYGGLTAKILKIPTVATAHGPWDTLYFYQDLLTSLFVEKILANSPSLKNKLAKRKIIASQKIDHLPFGVDTQKFKPAKNKSIAKKKLGFSQNDFIITMVGRLDPIKDHLTFLKAAKLILKDIPSSQFLIIGSKLGDFSKGGGSYLEQIKNYLKENPQLSQKVTFAGFIKNMPSVYQASDVFVSTSKSESFGLALAEAAASCLPIVATNSGNQKMIVKNSKNGFLVPPQNPAAIAQQVSLLKNIALRQSMGNYGRKYVTKNFELRRYVDSVEKNYLELLRNKNRP